jgi:hypothetical protein
MSSKWVVEAIRAFAPTVADKVLDLIGNKKVGKDDLNILLITLLAEQNMGVAKCLEGINGQLQTVSKSLELFGRELKTLNEGVAVLLKRTE